MIPHTQTIIGDPERGDGHEDPPVSLVEHVTADQCRERIAQLESEAGANADDLRVMRKRWEMTVKQRDTLDQIEDYEFLLGGNE